MASHLPQEPFDTLMFSHAMMRMIPRVDEDAQFASQCACYLKTHKADDYDALVRGRDKLTPLIERQVDRICDEIYSSGTGRRPEHRLAVLRLMLTALHNLHNEQRTSIWRRIAGSARRQENRDAQSRLDRSSANIRTAAELVLLKTSLRRVETTAS
jgi:hypothetical protein